MEDFRKYLLIPLALTVASWAATGYLKLPLEPRAAFVISLAFVAILAGLPFREPSEKASPPKPVFTWQSRATWLTAGIVSCCLAALVSGMIGYLLSPKATQPLNEPRTTSMPSGPQPAPGDPDTRVKRRKADSPPGTELGKADERRSEVDLFFEKYVNNGINRTSGKPHWAFVASDQTHTTMPEFDSAIASALAEAGFRNVDLLRPSLVNDGKLGELYDPDPILMRRLAGFCDGIIVAIADSHPVEHTDVTDINTVELSIQVRVMPFTDGSVAKAFSVLERGAGFTVGEAERNARQRASESMKQQLSVALHQL
jgi:hypothetical protein